MLTMGADLRETQMSQLASKRNGRLVSEAMQHLRGRYRSSIMRKGWGCHATTPQNGLACDLDHTSSPSFRPYRRDAALYRSEVYIPRVTRDSRDLRARGTARCSATG